MEDFKFMTGPVPQDKKKRNETIRIYAAMLKIAKEQIRGDEKALRIWNLMRRVYPEQFPPVESFLVKG